MFFSNISLVLKYSVHCELPQTWNAAQMTQQGVTTQQELHLLQCSSFSWLTSAVTEKTLWEEYAILSLNTGICVSACHCLFLFFSSYNIEQIKIGPQKEQRWTPRLHQKSFWRLQDGNSFCPDAAVCNSILPTRCDCHHCGGLCMLCRIMMDL